MAKKAKPKPALKMDDALRTEIALARFEGGELVDLKTLADRYGKSTAAISRATAEAFRSGLVEVRAKPRPGTKNRNRNLESRICGAFTNLKHAIVLQPDKVLSSDALHEALGEAAAMFIHESEFFMDGDMLGLSGGRAVYHLAMALRQMEPMPINDISLYALCGCIYPEHDEPKNLRLDADWIVNEMGPAFRGHVRMRQVSYPIWARDEETWRLSPLGNNWQRPRLIVSGLGVLNATHRLVRMATESNRQEWNMPCFQEVRSIMREVGTNESLPLGEIALSLFPTGERVKPALRERLERLQKTIFAVERDQLRSAQGIFLIAGGHGKVPAIRAALMGDLPIRYLCTCKDTALSLLGESSN